MKKPILFLIVIVLFASCANVKFYSDASLSDETGIKIYTPKPYLLVEHNPTDSIKHKSTIIYLPDLNSAQYAKFVSGFGKADFNIALENGYLKTYGIVTDTNIPETITSLSELITSLKSADTQTSNEKEKKNPIAEEAKPAFELFEIKMNNGITSLIKVNFN